MLEEEPMFGNPASAIEATHLYLLVKPARQSHAAMTLGARESDENYKHVSS